MKIKITETQAKRLKLINEESLPLNTDPIQILRNYVGRNEPIIVKIFNELTNLTLMEISDYDFDSVSDTTSKFSDMLDYLRGRANNYIETQPEEDNWELEGQLDDAYRGFYNKIEIVDDLLYEMKKIKDFFIEKEAFSKFPSLDITDIQ
jgi:hypothetical protein